MVGLSTLLTWRSDSQKFHLGNHSVAAMWTLHILQAYHYANSS